MLWECSAYSSSRADFLLKLQEKLGNGFERFDALDSLGKSSFILGSELWEEHFDLLYLPYLYAYPTHHLAHGILTETTFSILLPYKKGGISVLRSESRYLAQSGSSESL